MLLLLLLESKRSPQRPFERATFARLSKSFLISLERWRQI